LVLAPVFGQWVKRHQRSFLAVFVALLALVFVSGAASIAAQLAIGALTLGIIALILWKVNGSDAATAKEWSWLFWWALVTHPLLDCHTTWGTQLFWPFPWKIAYNNIFVVDPAYTVPFLICVVIVLFLERTDPRRRWINGFGLVLSSAYMALTLVTKSIAHTRIEDSLVRQDIAYNTISTRPAPFNTILWTANVDRGDHYALAYHSMLDTKPEVEFVHVARNLALLGPWADHDKVRRLVQLTEGNYVIQMRNDTLLFCDLRFGQIGEPAPDKPFVFSYALIPEGEDLRVVQIPSPRPDGQRMREWMSELWERIKGE
jgi:inner membrane protein